MECGFFQKELYNKDKENIMNINTVFANLEAQIIGHKETYSRNDNISNVYDDELVDFLLQKITSEDIKNYNYFNIRINNRSFSTNLSGYINYLSLYRFGENGDDKRNTEFFNYWSKRLLINEPPVYTLKVDNKKKEIEVGVSYLLTNQPTVFIKLIEQNKIQLNEVEEKLFVEDLLFNDSDRMPYAYIKDDALFKEYLFNILKKHYHSVREDNGKNEKAMLSKVFASKEFLKILSMNNGGWEKVFPENLCDDIYKKCSVKEIRTTTPHLLSSLMYIAPPEKWIEENNIFSFFKDIIKVSTGYKIEDLEKELKSTSLINKNIVKSSMGAKEWLERFKYMATSLSEDSFNEKEKSLWYLAVVKTTNIELFQESLKYISFPSYEKGIFHDLLINEVADFKNQRTWNDLLTVHNKERLEKALEVIPSNSSNIKKLKV